MKQAILLWLVFVAVAVATEPSTPTAESGSVQLNFVDEDVRNVIKLYTKLTHLKVIQDNFVQGKMSVTTAEPVSAEKAIEMIERTLFANGYPIMQVSTDTVEVIGAGKNPRAHGLPIISDPKDLPAHERVISYLFTFKNRDAAAMQQAFGQYLSPPQTYTSLLTIPNTNAVLLTERSSVIRRLVDAMEEIDVPDAKSGRAKP